MVGILCVYVLVDFCLLMIEVLWMLEGDIDIFEIFDCFFFLNFDMFDLEFNFYCNFV